MAIRMNKEYLMACECAGSCANPGKSQACTQPHGYETCGLANDVEIMKDDQEAKILGIPLFRMKNKL
jgi:hypothetical protein